MTANRVPPRHSWARTLLFITLPGAITSGCFGYLSAWLIAVRSQPKGSGLVFWSPLTIVLAALLVIGALIWLVGSAALHRDTYRQMASFEKKLDELPDQVVERLTVVKAGPQLEVSRNDEPARLYGSTLTVPAGTSVAAALGVGPLTFVVPSGVPFGIERPGPVRITVDLEGSSIRLPEGGTISVNEADS